MIIGLTGYAQTGKDTVANILCESFGYVRMAFADGVRDLCAAIDPYIFTGQRHFTLSNGIVRYTELLREVGYERAKGYEDMRRFLQRVGTEGGRGVFGEETWVDLWVRRALASTNRNIVVTDVRFENEAQAIINLGGIVVRTKRPGQGPANDHASENSMDGWAADYTLEANSPEELRFAVLSFMYDDLPDFENTEALLEAQFNVIPLVYLAAPLKHKAEAVAANEALKAAGLRTTARWMYVEKDGVLQDVQDCMTDTMAADTIVLLSLAKSAGKATEFGMGLAMGKKLIVVGHSQHPEDKNSFYFIPGVLHVDTLQDAIALLGGIPTAEEATNV